MEEPQEHNRIVYCDMDGVIADFDSGFESITQLNPDQIQQDEMWAKIEAHGKAKFFSELPWMPGGKELWAFVSQNFLQVKILTALGKSDAVDKQTTTGKRDWLRKNVPNLQDSDIIMVANKHKKRHYSKPGDIIIDDTEVVIQEWLKKGGIGILHKTAHDTISKLRQYV